MTWLDALSHVLTDNTLQISKKLKLTITTGEEWINSTIPDCKHFIHTQEAQHNT